MRLKKLFAIVALETLTLLCAGAVFAQDRKQNPPTMTADRDDDHDVVITSFPDGATVWIDGIDSGLVTPMELKRIKPGQHTIRVSVGDPAWLDDTRTVNVLDLDLKGNKRDTHLSFTLVPRMTTGAVGPSGPQGPAGAAGLQGPAGPSGVGLPGSSGLIGPQGPAGPTGAAGLQGPAGPAGVDGAVGPMGANGATGAAGTNGNDGAVGQQGPMGMPGLSIVGPIGPQGPAGTNGTNGLPGAVGPKGDVGAVGPIGANGLPGTVGAQGPQGLTGAEGPQGVQGLPGAKGDSGVQGLKGDAGVAGAVGAVGPQGLPGAVGAVGPQGPIGLTGSTGPQGSQGVKGDAGVNGATGSQGPIGLTGATGPAGTNGTNGLPGATGAASTVPGPAGAAGATGSQGPTGPSGRSPFQGVWSSSSVYQSGDMVVRSASGIMRGPYVNTTGTYTLTDPIADTANWFCLTGTAGNCLPPMPITGTFTGSSIGASTTYYFTPSGNVATLSTSQSSTTSFAFPMSATLSSFVITSGSAPANGNTWVGLTVNGNNVLGACEIQYNGGVSNSCTVTLTGVHVYAGDTMTLSMSGAGGTGGNVFSNGTHWTLNGVYQ